MKIGYVLKKFPRYSETFILREVLGLEEAGVPLQIFALNPPRDGRFHASLARLRHTVEYLPESGIGAKSLAKLLPELPVGAEERDTVSGLFWESVDRNRPQVLKSLVAALHLVPRIREHGITHLHAHFATSASEVARMAAAMTGIGFSFTAHAKDIFSEDVDREGLDLKFRDCRFAVTVCEANMEFLHHRHPVSRNKLVRLYNGIDIDRWGEVPDVSPESQDGVPLILAVGRFVEKKGFGLLLEALASLAQDNVPFRASILGDGELWDPLRAEAKQLGLAQTVSFPGAASSEQVRAAMRAATLLVCPSVQAGNGDRDALPTVLLEALAAGTPAVATPVGGIAEILDDGKAGLLVEPNARSLAKAMRWLLREPERAASLAGRGQSRARELFDVRKNARFLAECFEHGAPRETAPVRVANL